MYTVRSATRAACSASWASGPAQSPTDPVHDLNGVAFDGGSDRTRPAPRDPAEVTIELVGGGGQDGAVLLQGHVHGAQVGQQVGLPAAGPTIEQRSGYRDGAAVPAGRHADGASPESRSGQILAGMSTATAGA